MSTWSCNEIKSSPAGSFAAHEDECRRIPFWVTSYCKVVFFRVVSRNFQKTNHRHLCLFLPLGPWCFRSRTVVFLLVQVFGGHQLSNQEDIFIECRSVRLPLNFVTDRQLQTFLEVFVRPCHRFNKPWSFHNFYSQDIWKLHFWFSWSTCTRLLLKILLNHCPASCWRRCFHRFATQWKYSQTNRSNSSGSNAPRGWTRALQYRAS